jgi:hypothetical protein
MRKFRADDPDLEGISNKLLDDARRELSAEEAAVQSIWLERQLQHWRIVVAVIENKDLAAGLALAGSDPELLQFVARAAAYKRGRGEQKNRPNDFPSEYRTMLEEIWFEVNSLRQLWKQCDIKIVADRNREGGPKWVALDIVLRRNFQKLDDELKATLINFDKNRRRRH